MDEQAIRKVMSGEHRGVGTALLRGVLSLASGPYAAVSGARRWAYRHSLLRSYWAPMPVISIGNITAGGTGKTPMVAWVVARLHEMGQKPAILMRGYRARSGVSDEAQLLQQVCGEVVGGQPAVPVIVSPNRVAGALAAVDAGADVTVMDDGFQHRRLRRDLDIVLIDATNPFGYGRCLPRGLLREPLSALRDADALVVTRADVLPWEQLDALREVLTKLSPHATHHAAIHRPSRLIDQAGREVPLSALTEKRSLAFCGLGNPHAFWGTLEKLGAAVADRVALADHAHYTPAVAASLVEQAKQYDAEVLVTTQKDAVKLDGLAFDLPVWHLQVELEVIDGRDELLAAIQKAAAGR